MINKFFLTILLCLINTSIDSQSEKRKIFAKKVSEEIVLDGEMNESFWKIRWRRYIFIQNIFKNQLKIDNTHIINDTRFEQIIIRDSQQYIEKSTACRDESGNWKIV